MTPPPVIVVGAGEHGRVVVDALQASGREVAGFSDADPGLHGSKVLGLTVLGDDAAVLRYSPAEIELANGVGSVRDTAARAEVFGRLRARGYRFATVRHPAAVVSRHAEIGEGAQLMAGCVVQVGARLEGNVLVNTSASVDHDCVLGQDVHIAPGATLSGRVLVGAGTHVGTGACVIQGVRIGRGCIIGAGSLVLRSVPDRSIAIGVPARVRSLA
jgi:UDP-perosamine 4-acetyltransferase